MAIPFWRVRSVVALQKGGNTRIPTIAGHQEREKEQHAQMRYDYDEILDIIVFLHEDYDVQFHSADREAQTFVASYVLGSSAFDVSV